MLTENVEFDEPSSNWGVAPSFEERTLSEGNGLGVLKLVQSKEVSEVMVWFRVMPVWRSRVRDSLDEPWAKI